ncbi:hypothetical protein GCM10023238_39630 [Streptomyces heliomycini]
MGLLERARDLRRRAGLPLLAQVPADELDQLGAVRLRGGLACAWTFPGGAVFPDGT